MRILLFFDLPTITKKNIRDYNKFRKKLIRSGFYMIQESVYVKMTLDIQSANSTISKVKLFLPPLGNVMTLIITEKQFSGIKVLLGETKSDVLNTLDRIVEL